MFYIKLKFSTEMSVLPTVGFVKFEMKVLYQKASFMRKSKN